MNNTQKIIESLMSTNNTLRLISEIALKDLADKQPDLLLKDLTEIISKGLGGEFVYFILRVFVVDTEYWETLAPDIKFDIYSRAVYSIGESNSACLLVSSLMCFELNSNKNSVLLAFLATSALTFEVYNGKIRTFGYLLESNPKITSEDLGRIFDEVCKGLENQSTRITSLKALRRSVRIPLGNNLINHIGILLYQICQDVNSQVRVECLETIIEYTEAFRDHGVYLEIDTLLKILIEDNQECQVLALAVICIMRITDFRVIDFVVSIVENENMHMVCIEYLIIALENDFMLEYIRKYIRLDWKPLTALSIIGCIPISSWMIQEYLGEIINFLQNATEKLLEIATWTLSQIASPQVFQENTNEIIRILLGLIFPTMDYYEKNSNIKVYSCWVLKEVVKNRLNSQQILFLIEKIVKIDGNSEEIYAGWSVINELIEISNVKECTQILNILIQILSKDYNQYRIECIYSALSGVLLKLPESALISEKTSDLIVKKIVNPEFSTEKALFIRVLSISLHQPFEKYLSNLIPYLITNIDSPESIKTLTHIIKSYPLSANFIPFLKIHTKTLLKSFISPILSQTLSDFSIFLSTF